MAVTFEKKDLYGGRVYPFHVEPVKRDVMGYRLDGVAAGDVISQGTPIVADGDNKTAVICKHAKVVQKKSNTEFVVEYIGYLKVNDTIFCSGATNPVLSEIKEINKDTRTITLKAANNQLDAGKILVEGETVKGEGDTNVVQAKHVPNRIVARTQTMAETNKTISATHSAVVIENVVDYPVEWLNKTTFPGTTLLAGCPLIIFIKQ